MDLIGEVGTGFGEALGGVGLHLGQQLLGVVQKLVDGPCIGGVEGQGDHGLHPAQINGDHPVVVSRVSRMQRRVVLLTLMRGIEASGFLVSLPDGGKTGGLGGHHVNAVAEVDGQLLDAGAYELQHLVVDKAAFKCGFHQRDGHVVGADAPAGLAGQIYHHHFRHGSVPGVLQQLLGQLRAAFAHGHGAQRTVTGVRVGTQDHGAAFGHLLTGVGVDDALVGRHIDAAVLLGSGQAKHMVVLVDGTAYGAQAVMAVGQGVGNGEFLHTGGPGLLDDTYVSNIVGHHGVKADAQMLRIAGNIVGLQNTPRHSALTGFCLGDGRTVTWHTVYQIHTVVDQLDHD